MAVSFYRAAVLLVWTACLSLASAAQEPIHTLPIFYFHGINGNAGDGINFQKNLSTDARPVMLLNFCENLCTLQNLNLQTSLAIAQIRNITSSDKRFDNGYIFIGHSQGAAIARSVIEEMDDHKVHSFVSLAGAVNGIFYGPQDSDYAAGLFYIKYYAPVLTDPRYINYSTFVDNDVYTGKAQLASIKVDIAHPELQDVGSGYNMAWSPVQSEYVKYNKFFAVINNRQPSTDATVAKAQARRKANFIKLKAAYFFGSPLDRTVSPWQQSLMGQYNELPTLDALEKGFRDLKIQSMQETYEYKQDTYGLKTLDERGGIFLHAEENVSHSCWIANSTPLGGTECKFLPVWEKLLYPLLKTETPPRDGCYSSD